MVWLTMYADFITSLTLFFILLFYSAMLSARKSLTPDEVNDYNQAISSAIYDKEDKVEKKAKEQTQQISATEVEAGKLLKDFAGVLVNRREVVITLPEAILFESGKAKINDEARPVLNTIGQIMVKYPGKIVIEGHTDDLPINQQIPKGAKRWEIAMARSTGLGPYTSNWELSGARSLQVMTFFSRGKIIDPGRLVVRACGPSQPVYPNDSDEHRAKNRRIEIKTRLR